MKVSKFPAPIVEQVYKSLRLNRKAKYSWLQDNLGVSEATIVIPSFIIRGVSSDAHSSLLFVLVLRWKNLVINRKCCTFATLKLKRLFFKISINRKWRT